MTHRFTTLLGAAALLALPAMAEARSMGQGAMLPGFDMLDTDNSGAVTLEQFQSALSDPRALMREQMITRLMQEADAEGKLDEAALRAGLAGYTTERREARAAAMQARLFARIDADGDGVISAEEYEAFQNRSAPRMERRGMRSDMMRRDGPRRWMRTQ